MNFAQAKKIIDQLKPEQTKVLVTGVFDLLHSAHLEFLNRAKACGDFLVVGLESDVRVTQMKGLGRPINSELVRLKKLKQLNIADLVFILPEAFSTPADHENLIKQLQPDILAVSSHTKHLEAKKRILNKFGGDVKIVYDHDPSISTSILLNNPKSNLPYLK